MAIEQHVSAEAALPSRFGDFRIGVYRAAGTEVVAISHGTLAGAGPTLVRLHSECLTGDALGSLRCDCGEQLQAALETIAREQRGVVLYLRHEGRGIGLFNKIRAYALQDRGLDTVDANVALGLPIDARDYTAAAWVLKQLGIRDVRLITNNPAKIAALHAHGINVVERIPVEMAPNPKNAGYLKAKADRMGHLLDLPEILAANAMPTRFVDRWSRSTTRRRSTGGSPHAPAMHATSAASDPFASRTSCARRTTRSWSASAPCSPTIRG